MTAGTVAALSCGVAVLGCLLNLWNAARSRAGDRENDARWRGTVDAKLERILADVQTILTRQEAAETRMEDLGRQLTEVEGRSKVNEHRMDEWRKRA